MIRNIKNHDGKSKFIMHVKMKFSLDLDSGQVIVTCVKKK